MPPSSFWGVYLIDAQRFPLHGLQVKRVDIVDIMVVSSSEDIESITVYDRRVPPPGFWYVEYYLNSDAGDHPSLFKIGEIK
jgi:hypothetical protein